MVAAQQDCPPANDDRLHACRVVLGLMVPGLVLLITHRPDLLIYAVFGSFTGMYGRSDAHLPRVGHQAQAAALLVAGVGTGILLSTNHAGPWQLVTTEAVFASIGSLVSDRLGLRPQGPFYGIFAVGAIATIPSTRIVPWDALAISVATALFCIIVSCVAALLARAHPAAGAQTNVVPSDHRSTATAVHAARYTLAVSGAGAAGLLLGIDHANWAMAAAAVPLAAANARRGRALSARGVIQRGVQRMTGTLAGLVVAALLLLPQLGESLLGAVLIALLFPTELFMTRNYGLAVWFFTPLIMLMTQLAAPAEALTFLVDRAIDNVIGVSVGIAVALVVRTHRRPATWYRLVDCSGLGAVE